MKRLENTLFPDGPSEKDIVEFYGDEGTGKTQMLLHIISQCILPAKWKGFDVGGLGVGVVLVDTDYHFSMIRLVSMMEHTLQRAISVVTKNSKHSKDGEAKEPFKPPSEEDIELFIKQCLGKLEIVKCNSSTQLIITLYSLESLFGNRLDLCLLLIDSISAFYWIDRNNGGDSYSAQEMNQRKVAEAITQLRDLYKIVTIVTKPAIFQKRLKETEREKSDFDSPGYHSGASSDKSSEHCEYLCKPWQRLVTHRFLFSRQEIVTKSSSGGVKQRLLYTVKGGKLSEATTGVNVNFYISDVGILFIKS